MSTPTTLGSRIEISGYDPSETVDDLMWLSAESFAKKIGAMYAKAYGDFCECRIRASSSGGPVDTCLLFRRDTVSAYPLVNAVDRDNDGTYRLTEDGKEGIEEFLLPNPKSLEAMIFSGSAANDTDWEAVTDEERSEDGTICTRVSRLDANRLAAAAYGRGDSRTEYKYRVTAKSAGDPCTLEISREARTIVCIGCGVY